MRKMKGTAKELNEELFREKAKRPQPIDNDIRDFINEKEWKVKKEEQNDSTKNTRRTG